MPMLNINPKAQLSHLEKCKDENKNGSILDNCVVCMEMETPSPTLLICNLILFFSQISHSTDTISQEQPLADDGSTLVSKDGTFELGFFNLGSSNNRYVGIWYKNIAVKTVVWVANRDNPIKDNNSTTMLKTQQGNLVLLTHNDTLLWTTNATAKASNPIVQLLDDGNLVIRDAKEESDFVRQSFDHPCDTLLSGMKLGWDIRARMLKEKKDQHGQEDLELPFFDFATIVKAIDNFSIDNKLGEGDFGPVYKDILVDEQEIAIKRLSRSSGQGLKEFRNEVILCAKLQHRNLAKVIGYCPEGEEKMLLYEYMPN
ncbi:hypothetical protein Fmac_020269 [Flemingia macrophylla]|uniref:non-specific serine/threonine protein kinase n=1 Tax=Flemingia macrophylla TaxID=520843 RepID=A0ABD1LTJ4_9FABA